MSPVFIGDEVTAAAYRLAGFDVRVPAPGEAPAAFRRALDEAPPLILLGAECAAALPGADLDAALLRCEPPVAIVPDAAARTAFPDYSARVRASLGIAS